MNSSSKFATEMLYLEEDPRLNFNLPGVLSIHATQINSMTRLDVHAAELSTYCGLRTNCLCRRQYTIKILPSGNYTIHQENSLNVIFNFYDPVELYGLSIVSGVVSSSERCSRKSGGSEISTIFWMKFDDYSDTVMKNPVKEIHGFIADAQRFVFNGRRTLRLLNLHDYYLKDFHFSYFYTFRQIIFNISNIL
jgi:hypothetical protein